MKILTSMIKSKYLTREEGIIRELEIYMYTLLYLYLLFTLTLLVLHCCAWSFSTWDKQSQSPAVLHGLLIEVASLVAKQGFCRAGAVVVPHTLSCPAACGIFPDQGSNPCPHVVIFKADNQKRQGNSAQCYVAAWMGEAFEGQWVRIWMDASLGCARETVPEHC